MSQTYVYPDLRDRKPKSQSRHDSILHRNANPEGGRLEDDFTKVSKGPPDSRLQPLIQAVPPQQSFQKLKKNVTVHFCVPSSKVNNRIHLQDNKITGTGQAHSMTCPSPINSKRKKKKSSPVFSCYACSTLIYIMALRSVATLSRVDKLLSRTANWIFKKNEKENNIMSHTNHNDLSLATLSHCGVRGQVERDGQKNFPTFSQNGTLIQIYARHLVFFLPQIKMFTSTYKRTNRGQTGRVTPCQLAFGCV